MPTQIAILTPDGLQVAPYEADSLAEASQYERDGVYTVTRTYNRVQTLHFNAHLDRMEQSARLEGMSLQLDRAALRHALRQLIDESGYNESRFRVTIPRYTPEQRVLTLEPFVGIPPQLKADGVAVATVNINRETPESKDNAWMQQRTAALQHAPDAYEHLIINDAGQLLEGFGSNFYAVVDGKVYTAPDGTVLGGISRSIVLDVAPDICPLVMEAVTYMDDTQLDEAFLTSSSRGVMPIIKINEHVIGDGKPGTLTRSISARYDAWVEAHLEDL